MTAEQRASAWWEAAKYFAREWRKAGAAVDGQRDRALAAEHRAEGAEEELRELRRRHEISEDVAEQRDAHRARADAAEAKQRIADEHHRMELREAERERDLAIAALSKLDAITDHAGGFHAAMLGPYRHNPAFVRARAVKALDGIRDVLEEGTREFVELRKTHNADRALLDEICAVLADYHHCGPTEPAKADPRSGMRMIADAFGISEADAVAQLRAAVESARAAAAPAAYVCPGCGKTGRRRQAGEQPENDPECTECATRSHGRRGLDQ